MNTAPSSPFSQAIPHAVLSEIFDNAAASLLLPEDFLLVSAGLPAREPFVITRTEVSGRDEIDRFLSILAALYRKEKWRFENAAPLVKGTKRNYFGRTYSEVASTGSSNTPEQIPGSEWWVSSNNDGPRKRAIVERLMVRMGFSVGYAELIASAIDYPTPILPWKYYDALRKLRQQNAA